VLRGAFVGDEGWDDDVELMLVFRSGDFTRFADSEFSIIFQAFAPKLCSHLNKLRKRRCYDPIREKEIGIRIGKKIWRTQ
jgi:hypothetical protein